MQWEVKGDIIQLPQQIASSSLDGQSGSDEKSSIAKESLSMDSKHSLSIISNFNLLKFAGFRTEQNYQEAKYGSCSLEVYRAEGNTTLRVPVES